MARHIEPLNGGLWTAPDPGVLQEGQLSSCRNGIYLAGSQALQRATGRQSFGVVSAVATAVVGLRDIQFDNSDHYLVALAGTKYRYAPVGDSGSFTDLATLTVNPSQLEVAHYRNRFYFFNGAEVNATATAVNSNLVVYLSATAASTVPSSRQHGMVPVSDTPAVTTAVGVFSQTVTGYYEYWTTEMAQLTQDGAGFVMESTYSSLQGPATVFVSTTAVVPTIIRPTIKNPAVATHWMVYRSPKKDKESDKKFPSGFAISSPISIAATSHPDTITVTNTGAKFPASFNGVSPDTSTIYAGFTNASALGAAGAGLASASTTSLLDIKQQGVYGFNFGGFTGAVKGIEVVVASASVNTGTSTVGVTLVRKRQADGGIIPSGFPPALQGVAGELFRRINTAAKSFVATTVATSYTLGSSTDRWFASDNPNPLADTDFGTDFMVMLTFMDSVSTTLSADALSVNVYYGGSIESVTPFATVVYTFGDVSAQVGKNGPPPSSTTGDFYEDSLVVNDVSNPAVIRYSVPGSPDAFPGTYYVDFETRENDRVRVVKVVNDQLLVWLDASTWRLNYLPSERDASFDRGKCKKPISTRFGCINPMCCAVFSPGGDSEVVAWVSHHGIHGSNAFDFETYTEGLNWRDIMSASSTAIALIDDRETATLRFYFTNPSAYGSETYMCLPLCYGDGHWLSGKPKVGGLIHMRNHDSGSFASLHSAWGVQRQSGPASVYLGYGGTSTNAGSGKVYIETGTTIPALDHRLQYNTRRLYLAGPGHEWEFGELYGYASASSGTVNTYTLTTTKTNDSGPTQKGSKSITLAGQPLHKAGVFREMCEGAVVGFAATASAYAAEYLVIDGKNFGLEDSGR